jgi:hypothetical protein
LRQFSINGASLDRNLPFVNKDSPSIAALPNDGKSWRIDWFGDLAFPNRSIRRTQPSLLLHLSRVHDANFRDDPSVLLSPDSTSPARFQRKIWVSGGTLPLLRIGDIWRNGKLELSPDYQLESFAGLRIDDTTVHLIKAGLNLDDKGFLLPLSEHPWHLQCTHSYCVMVELGGDRQIIIPCIELIRFYFGSSSGLITKLFLPPLERKSLYGNARFDTPTRRLVLELAEKISGASAADIGRLHLDPVAWRAAVHIGTSALKASVANQNIYPQAIFPFEGDTTLIAAGKWLSLGDQANATFLVYSLRSCSHPFPFRTLSYKAHYAHSASRTPDQSDQRETAGSMRRSASDSRDQSIVEQDASSGLASKAKPIRLEPRFPDLRKKAIWKEKTLKSAETDGRAKWGAASSSAVDRASIGEAGSGQRIRPVELAMILGDPGRRRRAPVFLRQTIDELARLNGLDIDLLTESDEDGWTVPITALSDKDGEIDLQLFINGPEGMLRLRRVSVFAIKRDKEHISVVFIESWPVYIKIYTTNGQSANEIYETISCAVADYLSRPECEIPDIVALVKWIFEIDN